MMQHRKKPSIAQDEDTTTTKIDYVSENDAAAQVKLGSVVISQLFDITYGTKCWMLEKMPVQLH